MPATLTADQRRREAFGTALREAMHVKEVTQAALGNMLDRMKQSTISAWTTGDALPPDVETVFRLEQVLGLNAGHLSRYLGFRPEKENIEPDVRGAILADTSLDPAGRRALLDVYERLAGSVPAPKPKARTQRGTRARHAPRRAA